MSTMRSLKTLSILLAGIAIVSAQVDLRQKPPESSALSSIPSFGSLSASLPSFPCVSSNRQLKGSCHSTAEKCIQEGLVPDGPCPMFKDRLCCVPPVKCGATVNLSKQNAVFLSNPNFPQPLHEPILCDYQITIPRQSSSSHSATSHLRLDLVQFEMAQPSKSSGFCETDAMFVEGDVRGNWLRLCGLNSGQHFLIRLADATNKKEANGKLSSTSEIKLRFLATNNQTARRWLIQVQGVSRDSELMPDHPDCAQQYVEHENMIRSLNWEGHQTLHGWQYAICIRPQTGYCKLRVTAQDFELSSLLNRHKRAISNISSNLINQTENQVSTSNPTAKIIHISEPEVEAKTAIGNAILMTSAANGTESNASTSTHPVVDTLEDAYWEIDQQRQSIANNTDHQPRSMTSDEGLLNRNHQMQACSSDQDFLQFPPSFDANTVQCDNQFNFGKPIITNLGPNLIYVSHAGNTFFFNFLLKSYCISCVPIIRF